MDPMIRPPPDPRHRSQDGPPIPRIGRWRSWGSRFGSRSSVDHQVLSLYPTGDKLINPMVGAYMGVSLNGGFSPQIIHFNGVFHHKPSILGYHYFRKPPYTYPFYKDSPLKGEMIIPTTRTLDPRTWISETANFAIIGCLSLWGRNWECFFGWLSGITFSCWGGEIAICLILSSAWQLLFIHWK